jgi:hypothetical protein
VRTGGKRPASKRLSAPPPRNRLIPQAGLEAQYKNDSLRIGHADIAIALTKR